MGGNLLGGDFVSSDDMLTNPLHATAGAVAIGGGNMTAQSPLSLEGLGVTAACTAVDEASASTGWTETLTNDGRRVYVNSHTGDVSVTLPMVLAQARLDAHMSAMDDLDAFMETCDPGLEGVNGELFSAGTEAMESLTKLAQVYEADIENVKMGANFSDPTVQMAGAKTSEEIGVMLEDAKTKLNSLQCRRQELVPDKDEEGLLSILKRVKLNLKPVENAAKSPAMAMAAKWRATAKAERAQRADTGGGSFMNPLYNAES